MCKFDWGSITCMIMGQSFYGGQKTLKATSREVAKYDKSCSHNQYVFTLFATDIFDFLVSKTIDILHKI